MWISTSKGFIVHSSSSGLGHDNKAYVYIGGTALGNQAGSATSNKGVNLMVDTRKIYTYENQRWNPLSGFSDIGAVAAETSWYSRGNEDQGIEMAT